MQIKSVPFGTHLKKTEETTGNHLPKFLRKITENKTQRLEVSIVLMQKYMNKFSVFSYCYIIL